MTYKKIIQMIDEYLEEPHSLHKDWVEALQTCKQALLDNERLKELNARLNKEFNNQIDFVSITRAEAVKEFANKLKSIPVFYFYDEYIDKLVKEVVGK